MKKGGLPPHRWIKVCPNCLAENTHWDYKSRWILSGEKCCERCGEWVIPLKRRQFIGGRNEVEL